MSAVRAPTLELAPSFNKHVDALRPKYPEIDACVEDFTDTVRAYWTIPHFPVNPRYPNVYAEKIDYPDLGASGIGLFLVTYYASELTTNPMQHPLRRFVLISIT